MSKVQPDDLVRDGKYKAILHYAGRFNHEDGTQECAQCHEKLLDHSANLMDGNSYRVQKDGTRILGFQVGPVTTIIPPHPDQFPRTVKGQVKYARPCTIPEEEWPYA